MSTISKKILIIKIPFLSIKDFGSFVKNNLLQDHGLFQKKLQLRLPYIRTNVELDTLFTLGC